MEREQKKLSEILNFQNFPKQQMAWAAMRVYKYLLYGGAMGGGKSGFLRRAGAGWLTYLATKYNITGLRGALFCEDYPSLDDRQVSKIRPGGADPFPDYLGEWREGDHEFTAYPEYGAWSLVFRNLDKPSKYDSTEFAWIGVDEIQKNPYNTFKVLRRRLRWSLPDEELAKALAKELRFVAGANPGGESWVKDVWIDRIFPPEEKEPQQFYFIPSLPQDNPYLTEDYMLQLSSMSAAEQAAYMHGKWDAFEAERDKDGYLRLLSDMEVNNAIIDTLMHSGVTILGVDVGYGGDESTIIKKSDTQQQVLFNQQLADPMVLVQLVIKAMTVHEAKAIVVDITNGHAVYYRLVELKKKNKYNVAIYGISFGAKSNDPVRFEDMKAEMYWNQREWTLGGGKLIRDDGWGECKIIKYKKNSDEQICIQSKKELRSLGIKSPNVFDAAALTQFADPAVVLRRSMAARRGIYVDQADDFWKNG